MMGPAAVILDAHHSQAEAADAGKRRTGRGPGTGLVLLAVATLVFLASAVGIVAAPFGNSHDGRNGAVWAAGSRSIRHDGPIQSRLGTHSPENGVYANHPPLLYGETAVAEVLGAGSRAATRAPAWLGSLVLLGLLTALLVERGLRLTAAGMAVALTAATPMFLIYGTMLDTPVTSLSFGVGVLLLWERGRHGRRVRPLVAAAVTALAVLAGWQSLLVAAVVAGWAVLRILRRTARPGVETAFAAGAVAGLALLVAWLLWAFGGTPAPLAEQFLFRAGDTTRSVTTGALLAAQAHDIRAMFGVVAVLGAVGLVVAIANRRTRGLALVALAVTVPYPLAFRVGAVVHDYWDYWFLLPLAIGVAAGADALLATVASDPPRQRLLAVGAGALALVTAAAVLTGQAGPSWERDQGLAAGRLVTQQKLPSGQPAAWYAGAIGSPDAWVALGLRRPAVSVSGAALEELAATAPDDIVLVGEAICDDGSQRLVYSFQRAAAVAAQPPQVERCPTTRG